MSDLPAHAAAFAQAQGVPGDGWALLPADAGNRRYYRRDGTVFGPCLMMVTEPGAPDLEPYVRIAAHLGRLGLSAPKVFVADFSAGLALIEDFGDATYTRLLARGEDEAALYDLAIDALAALHERDGARSIELPPYDIVPLMREVSLFADWFAPTVAGAGDLDAFARAADAAWRRALADVATRDETLVLRDYHVDNLVLLAGRAGPARCGLLDFQDGLIGAAAYDVMSLTQDARRDIAPALETAVLDRYFAARPDLDRGQFLADYHLLGAQRHAKVAGIFHRLARRDGKPRYLAHVPRVLGLLDRSLGAAGLDEIRDLIDRALPGWRGAGTHGEGVPHV